MAAWSHGFGLLGFDLERAGALTSESVERSRELGFTWVTLDLEGFRSGSMNAPLGGDRRP